MEKLIELFKNHQGKNWTLFLITLGVVHSAWFYKNGLDIGTQNPYFIFLEILFIASGITRFLVAIDIFYIIETCPVLSDWITLLWKKRRDEWKRWKGYNEDYWRHTDYDYYEANINNIRLETLQLLCTLDELSEFERITGILIDHNLDDEQQEYITLTKDKFNIDDYHIKYWIKLEIKEYENEIAKEQGKKSFLDKTIIIGKKIGKYILSHVQKH